MKKLLKKKSPKALPKPFLKRVDGLEVRVDTLHTSLATFYGEFCDFRREMTFFKHDMLEFKADMLEFKDRTQTILENMVGTLETIHQEQLMTNATLVRIESTLGNHEGRLVLLEKRC